MNEQTRQELSGLAQIVAEAVERYDDTDNGGATTDLATAARWLRHAADALSRAVLMYT